MTPLCPTTNGVSTANNVRCMVLTRIVHGLDPPLVTTTPHTTNHNTNAIPLRKDAQAVYVLHATTPPDTTSNAASGQDRWHSDGVMGDGMALP
jgi:hypothetical protein